MGKTLKRICYISKDTEKNFEYMFDYFSAKSNFEVDFATFDKNCKFEKAKYIQSETAHEFLKKYNLIVLYESYEIVKSGLLNDFLYLNLHKSLLPAFDVENPIETSFSYGAKVGGITVQINDLTCCKKRILAQFPFVIPNLMHFDEYKNKIDNLSKMFYPIIVEKIAEEKMFDFEDLISQNKSCSNSCCGSCSSCNKNA